MCETFRRHAHQDNSAAAHLAPRLFIRRPLSVRKLKNTTGLGQRTQAPNAYSPQQVNVGRRLRVMRDDWSGEWALGPATRVLADRARAVMPGRQSNLRAADEPPVFVVRGEGQRMWDVDGRELLDFALGMGPNIWGHGNREYLAAVHAQLDQIFNVAAGMLQTPNEVYLAEKIVEHVPCAEQVRFLTSGSEAVQLVIRLARALRRQLPRLD
jgi:acetyl esterase/lipase